MAVKGLFSLVVPTFNVERYLDEFLNSLSAQNYPIDDVEIVFVDDGSTDSSAEIIAKWIATVAPSATLIQKPNGGLSSARNAGLDRVSGTWVTFSDPDDCLPPNYFATVAGFLTKSSVDDLHLLACRVLILDDRTGELRNQHPLRFRFEPGTRVVDLDRDPRYFHLQAASAFYRTELIEGRRLRFDDRVQPNFEDGHFTGLYLADQDRPRVALLADAVYHYRKRDDGSSLVQDSWNSAAKFTDVTRYGYLDLLQQVDARRGSVPIWLQNLVLYDLLGFFKQDERIHSTLGRLDVDVAKEFHEILREIMRYIDTATIDDYRINAASPEIRNALVIGAKDERLRPDHLRINAIDTDQRLAQVRYFYGGDLPREEFRVDGTSTVPVYGKCRSLTYLGKHLASERIVWLPATGTIQIALDGRRMRIELGKEPRAEFVIEPTELWRQLTSVGPVKDVSWYRALRRRAGALRRRYRRKVVAARAFRDRRLRSLKRPSRLATPKALRLRRAVGSQDPWYRNAWVFIDRNRQAQDNAEHLYRFVKNNHPEINAWFVVDRHTADWARLEGEGSRLVQYGSPEHLLLMFNCVELISSQVDHYVVHPVDTRRYGPQQWKFTFLQHGVTKDDLSRWVNGKPISRFITATEAEYQSIAGDDTPYIFTDKEVRLTGFPRHDRLLRLADDPRVRAGDQLLLVMPTWRRHLVGEADEPGDDRAALDGFWDSTYAKSWMELLESERLHELAEHAGLRIAFVPHPNMAAFLSGSSLSSHIVVHRYEDVDIQELFVRGAAMITDYSSNAFELAYLNRPVIYFQFDRASFFSGQHVYRQGNWSYERDGFGPVVECVSDVLDELERLVGVDLAPQEPYATRMEQGFAFRDGKACERVFESIVAIRRAPASA